MRKIIERDWFYIQPLLEHGNNLASWSVGVMTGGLSFSVSFLVAFAASFSSLVFGFMPVMNPTYTSNFQLRKGSFMSSKWTPRRMPARIGKACRAFHDLFLGQVPLPLKQGHHEAVDYFACVEPLVIAADQDSEFLGCRLHPGHKL